MKQYRKLIKQVMAGIMSLILLLCPVFLLQVNGEDAPGALYSTAAVLMDADSGRVLFSKNPEEVHAMASTTKIMTCILALELADLDSIVTFSESAASQPDVQMNGKEGEQYYLKDLLYSIMLESHNDSSVAVAEAIAGDVGSFTKLMDKKAEAIGCLKTNFVTPNGLDGEDERGDHCTTAEELAKILRYCIVTSSKAAEFVEITSAETYKFQEINGQREVYCQNHNALLNSYDGALTGKTGFTGKAGYCYTGAAKRGEETLIIALLGAGWYPNKSYKWVDARKLLDYGFENFAYEKVGSDEWKLPAVSVVDGMEKHVSIDTNAKLFEYLLAENEEVTCRMSYRKELKAPVAKDAVIGTISYELEGKIIEQFTIYTTEQIEKSTFRNILGKYLRNIQDFVLKLTNK